MQYIVGPIVQQLHCGNLVESVFDTSITMMSVLYDHYSAGRCGFESCSGLCGWTIEAGTTSSWQRYNWSDEATKQSDHTYGPVDNRVGETLKWCLYDHGSGVLLFQQKHLKYARSLAVAVRDRGLSCKGMYPSGKGKDTQTPFLQCALVTIYMPWLCPNIVTNS